MGGDMKYSINEVVFGALLHDIGKMFQRAYGSMKKVEWKTYDMESTLCPKNKHQGYTHKHVLFTNAFFDLIRQYQIPFPKTENLDHITAIASFHHAPDRADDPPIAWIITLADWYSSGMDRKDKDDQVQEESNRETYRRLPLQSIFDEITIDPDRQPPAKNAYTLAKLDPYSPDTLIPFPWVGENHDLPKRYKELTGSWISEVQKLKEMPELSNRLFEEILLGLLEKYTWAIPSSTMDIPDISLFDHSRTTAAIAASLYRYHEIRNELENMEAIKNETRPKFQFIAGDLSGIQNTLFTLENQGVKGVSKILRARSFMLGAITEAAALATLDALDLPLSCIIQQAGGRFLILAPGMDDINKRLNALKTSFDKWLLDHYSGSLAFNFAMSHSFSGQSFKSGGLHDIIAELSCAVENAKHQPLSTCEQGTIKREFPYDRACSACGVRPAEIHSDDEYRCTTCENEFNLGRYLTTTDCMVWEKGESEDRKAIPVMDLQLCLLKEDQISIKPDRTVSVRSLKPENNKTPWAYRIIANHIPRFQNERDLKAKKYEGIPDEENRFFSGMPKTFAHIGAEAKEFNDEEKTYRGKPFLGLLKADVDYLGYVFSYGLKRENKAKDRFTLSRVAQLSRMMDLYFTGYLQGIIRREYPDTYTIYAGGDDLLLIGPWFQMHKLAKRMRGSFGDYIGKNAHLTISAGLTLLHASYPVNRAVQEAEEMLDIAKKHDPKTKNLIVTHTGTKMTWEQYSQALNDAEWINGQMQGKQKVSTGFVYHILTLAKNAEDVANGDVSKAGWRAKLAYHLARNIPGKNKDEKNRNIADWLERLGLDNLFRLTKTGKHIEKWRLPITIALYRNRT
jgi:CRISPR-associated protein Csm1